MSLFLRTWAVTVGSLRVAKPLRVAFTIEKTVHAAPNKASLKLWNLTRAHQAQLEEQSDAPVLIEAGYEGEHGLETIFAGQVHRARGGHRDGRAGNRTEQDGPDVVTQIEAIDGGRSYREARVSQSFGAGTSVGVVVRACVTALGLGVGNLDEALRTIELEAGGVGYSDGTVLAGQASRELSRLLSAFGLRWSVQHGALQVLRRGQPLQTQAVRLSPETGLLGSPEIGTRGRVKVRALLTPELWPGRRVILSSQRLEGRFEVRTVSYEGDSHGDSWTAECELAPEGTAP